MKTRPQLITRIAIFSALVYVLSWATAYLPNVNFICFIVFSAGFLWGAGPGMMVGALGMWLFSSFNPYGPAPIPIMAAQIVGAAASGVVGSVYRGRVAVSDGQKVPVWLLMAAAVICTVLFYIPVNTVDAWMFQPFWPRFIGGLPWVAIALVSNILIFPLLFKATQHLYSRECGLR